MGFTLKAVETARNKRRGKGPLLRQQQNIPAVKAGPKNSNPTKAGANRSVKANRDSTNTLKGPRKVATGKNNTQQVVKSQGTPRPGKSSRLNYAFLRKLRG